MALRFALIGAAGYVAPKHMQAIKDIGGQLVAVLDPHDSVGILDRYFPECLYFREPERFDRFLSKNPVDYVSICSPNYLHDCHSLMAMRNGADVICEKPLVCNERNLDNLSEWEQKTGSRVNAILQCRLHPCAIAAKRNLRDPSFVTVDYRTPRGPWYQQSWKGDVSKSGGLTTNIGIHLFDLCGWLFGQWNTFELDLYRPDHCRGRISYESADVEWDLSTIQGNPKRVFQIDRASLDLTTGFADLHTESYKEIIAGRGFGIEDARPAIRLVEAMRNVAHDELYIHWPIDYAISDNPESCLEKINAG